MLEYLNVAVMLHADVAQSVAHLIGSEEVTGPIPVISSEKSLEFSRLFCLRLLFGCGKQILFDNPCSLWYYLFIKKQENYYALE